jgi:hypothetical protein
MWKLLAPGVGLGDLLTPDNTTQLMVMKCLYDSSKYNSYSHWSFIENNNPPPHIIMMKWNHILSQPVFALSP